jgi:glycosyltransferase involved in cell wall biosynthesis
MVTPTLDLCSATEERRLLGEVPYARTLGTEGIEIMPGRDILIEDRPTAFAKAVNHLLAEPDFATRIGQSAGRLAEEQYAWSGSAQALEDFYRWILVEVGA